MTKTKKSKNKSIVKCDIAISPSTNKNINIRPAKNGYIISSSRMDKKNHYKEVSYVAKTKKEAGNYINKLAKI